MHIVLTDAKHRKRKRADKRLERFDTLRERLRRKKLELERFEHELDEMMEIYRTRVLPVEAEEVGPLGRLAERLTVFMSRKTLGKYDREELVDWFWSAVHRIRAFDPERAETLSAAFEETVATYAGLTLEELRELEAIHEEKLREFEASIFERDGGEDDDWQGAPDPDQPDLFGFEDFFEELMGDVDGDVSPGGRDTGPGTPLGDSPQEAGMDAERLIDAAWIRGIFRRTAHALHPDREPDPAKRDEKHALMKQLLEARKTEDVMVILELYCEHVTGGEVEVANADLDSICRLMRERIDALDEEKEDMLHRNPAARAIYELLHGKSKRVRERQLEELIEELREQARDCDRLVGTLRNLDCLREVLRLRSHTNMQLMEDDYF